MEDRKLNIVQVNQTSGTGGSERTAFALATSLDRKLFNVIACALDGSGAMRREYAEAGMPFHDMKKRKGIDISLIPRLRRLIVECRADVVHTHDYGAVSYCFFATRMLPDTSLIHTNQCLLGVYARPKQAKLLRWVLPRVDALVSVSENVRQDYLQHAPASREMRVIYNAVDLPRFQVKLSVREARSRLGLSPNDFVVGCVGNLRPEKGQDMLLRAFRKVLDGAPDAHLVLVGGGECFEKWQRLADELELGGRAHFLGIRHDVPQIMRVLDVYCLCSLCEGMPVSILEAMAAGKTIVATDVPGTNEAVENGKNGILVPPHDSDALSAALLHLYEHPRIARSLALAGRRKAEEEYSLKRIVNEYAKLYRELVFGGRK
ncbi:MAG: glycosyltransferase [Planctomycetes bacterium]|nr:glycosyltransferase [Planctomycetota bacterium]